MNGLCSKFLELVTIIEINQSDAIWIIEFKLDPFEDGVTLGGDNNINKERIYYKGVTD